MSAMPDMMPMLLADTVAHCAGKIIKNGLCFWKRRKFATNGILHLSPIVRNRVTKFSERGL